MYQFIVAFLLLFTVSVCLGTNPSVTYTFSNSTTADATEVNTNFNDIINALTDGTKSLTIDALQADGASTHNGDVTLGNASNDDLTVNASLASNFVPDGNDTRALGSSSSGYSLLYLGNTSDTIGIQAPSLSASYTLTLPTGAGTDGYSVNALGSGSLGYLHRQPGIYNIGVKNATSSAANDSIEITSADGSAFSSTNPGYVVMPDVTDGELVVLKITSDVTIDLTGAHWARGTLGDLSAYPLRVYAINNNGNLAWGVSPFNIHTVSDSVDEATPTNVTGYDDVLVNTSLASGTWEAVQVAWFLADFDDTGGSSEDLWSVQVDPGSIRVAYRADDTPITGTLWRSVGNGHGSTNDKIRITTTELQYATMDVTFATTAAAGDSYTINSDGAYSITYRDLGSTGPILGITVNSTELTTSPHAASGNFDRILAMGSFGNNIIAQLTWTGKLAAGDVVRMHGDANANSTDGRSMHFVIKKLSD